MLPSDMKKVILVPDSFKGSMSSSEICGIMGEEVKRNFPSAEIISVPVADGGEGSVDCFLAAAGGKRVSARVKGPYMEEVNAFYGLIDSGRTAVIEMAACAGLPLVGDRLDPSRTTTFGVGELMLHAARGGCSKMIVCLGGSATNDFAAGAAVAAGVKFTDSDGNTFVPVGESLSKIAHIDTSGAAELKSIEITAMCDIDNPLYGPSGAAYVFAPQKGADAAMVEFLDGQLRSASRTAARELGRDVSEMKGAGAAGGMGGGLAAFFGAKLKAGIEIVLDEINFDELLRDADLVITGEGKLDTQSLRGKVVIGVARRAKKRNVPTVAIVGDIGDGINAAYDEGVSGIFSINRTAVPYSEAKHRSRSDLALTVDNLMRFIRILLKED